VTAEFITHYIFFGATVALIMAAMQITRGIKDVKSCMLFIFFFVMSLQLYQIFIIYQYFERPGFISQQLFGAPKFIIGPVLYIYFCLFFDRTYQFKVVSFFHFFPAFLSILHRIVFLRFYLPVDFGLSVSNEIFQKIAFSLDFTGFLLLLVYLFFTFQKIRLLSVISNIDKTIFKLSVFIIGSIAVISILYLASVFNPNELFVKISQILTSTAFIILFILSQKYPELLDWFRREVKEKSYKNSLLKGMNLGIIKNRLCELMEEDKVYYDDELTPQKLAGRLSVSSHQLSELLNQHMKMSFYNFINYYRINEVKKLLLKKEDQSILSIAYSVGFNSKSSFYDAFFKQIGMTPLQYRKASGKEER